MASRLDEALESMGNEGWDLVSVVIDPSINTPGEERTLHLFFKMEL